MSTIEAKVAVHRAERPVNFAGISIQGVGDGLALRVRYDQVPKSGLRPSEAAQDLLVVASTVYALDKSVRRESTRDRWTTDDNWTRDYVVTVPVGDPTLWSSVAEELRETASFLTGDRWQFAFEQREEPLLAEGSPRRVQPFGAEAVSLFSGGLDSLIGVVDWLEGNEGGLALVGHNDPSVAGPKGDQGSLVPRLRREYGERPTWINVGVGNEPNGPETTYRSRSIVFLALGTLVAECLGVGTRLMVPENGTIAVNPPLSPSRAGACSTRTTHPEFIAGFQRVLQAVGLTTRVDNPYVFRTKGQMVAECANQTLLLACLNDAISCAKRSHKSHWRRRNVKHCGRCMPCLYRRAALHTIGRDSHLDYGLDALRGEVDPRANAMGSEDLRALLGFLSESLDVGGTEMLLLENGRLALDDLHGHAQTVVNAMDEMRRLIHDHGSADIKRLAGVP